jgi:hypothetical protein
LLTEVAASDARIFAMRPSPPRTTWVYRGSVRGSPLGGGSASIPPTCSTVNHPADVIASSGRYAAGDWMLELFGGLFLIPTFVLLLLIRNSEQAYTRYSQILLGLSLTAPICVGLFLIPAVSQGNSFLGWFCRDRLLAVPIIVVGLAVSRLLARFWLSETPALVLVAGGGGNNRIASSAVSCFSSASWLSARTNDNCLLRHRRLYVTFFQGRFLRRRT